MLPGKNVRGATRKTNRQHFSVSTLPHLSFVLVPEQGLEPRLAEPESAVLPLDDSGIFALTRFLNRYNDLGITMHRSH